MRIAIMQPTYLPWIGYFALMDQVDQFVLLDDVEFSRQSWQQRNKIKTNNGSLWLTLPICKTSRNGQLINEVEINQNVNWALKHYKTLMQYYGSATYWQQNKPWLQKLYNSSWHSLCSLNQTIIETVANLLGISPTIHVSSNLDIGTGRIDRLIRICQVLGGNEYLSPIGSFEYIKEDNRFLEADIKLLYQHYQHPTYSQHYGEFISHLSVIDLLLNEGPRSLEVIRSGNRSPYTHEEVRELMGK